MRKLLFILFALIVAINANAQKQVKQFASDTISADTNVYVSNTLVKKYSNTSVAFVFTKADITDSLSVAKMQGSMNNSTWVDLTDATANLANTSTDGTTTLYIVNPIYLYYRGFLACASGDAVNVTSAWFVIKED